MKKQRALNNCGTLSIFLDILVNSFFPSNLKFVSIRRSLIQKLPFLVGELK
jgi:hypothetical protein